MFSISIQIHSIMRLQTHKKERPARFLFRVPDAQEETSEFLYRAQDPQEEETSEVPI